MTETPPHTVTRQQFHDDPGAVCRLAECVGTVTIVREDGTPSAIISCPRDRRPTADDLDDDEDRTRDVAQGRLWCPQCSWCRVDEDGCCVSCGATAATPEAVNALLRDTTRTPGEPSAMPRDTEAEKHLGYIPLGPSDETQCPKCGGRGRPDCEGCFGCGLDLSQHPMCAPILDALTKSRTTLESHRAENSAHRASWRRVGAMLTNAGVIGENDDIGCEEGTQKALRALAASRVECERVTKAMRNAAEKIRRYGAGEHERTGWHRPALFAVEVFADIQDAIDLREKAIDSAVLRDCTCLGSCKGPEGLGPGWRCCLSKESMDDYKRERGLAVPASTPPTLLAEQNGDLIPAEQATVTATTRLVLGTPPTCKHRYVQQPTMYGPAWCSDCGAKVRRGMDEVPASTPPEPAANLWRIRMERQTMLKANALVERVERLEERMDKIAGRPSEPKCPP